MTRDEGYREGPDGGGRPGAEARGAEAPAEAATAAPAAPPRRHAGPATLGDQPWFRELVAGANAGDREALAGLRAFLDDHPEVWRRAGDLTALAERAWAELIGGANALFAESLARSVAALKESLAGPDPTSLEVLLVGQVVVAWLAAQHGEAHAADPSAGSPGQLALRLRRAESGLRR